MIGLRTKSLASAIATFVLAVGMTGAAGAVTVAEFEKGITSCEGGACGWSLSVDGQMVLEGTYAAADDGSLFIPGGQTTTYQFGTGEIDEETGLPDVGSITLGGVDGNIDPILGFSAAASTGTLGNTFAFNFSLPIALSGLVEANSSVSYSLTSLSALGAQISPLFGHVVIAQDVDTSVGGELPINKGVDVGDTFFVLGGPVTGNSPVYTDSNVFAVTFDYDTMSATVAFSLSRFSRVGLSGFVEQIEYIPPAEIPEPGTYGLLCVGLGLVGFFTVRRRQNIG